MRESGLARGLAERAVILLHGRDRTKAEMLDLTTALEVGGTRWIAPAADSGKWYPNRFMDPRAANEPHLSRAIERCHRVVEDASEDGRLGPEKLTICGFSQGACIALEYVLRHPGCVGTLLVFTGALMGPPGTDWVNYGPSLEGLRVFLTGSDVDEWVSEQTVIETARVLAELGAKVTLRLYPGRPHVISEQELREARDFLLAAGHTARA